MKEQIDKLTSMKRLRVIDVGCGNCELSEDLLSELFTEIDFLDVN